MANYQPPTSGKFEIIHNLTIPIPKCDPFVPKAMDTPTMRVSLLSNLSSPTFKFPATSIPILPTNSINQKKHQLMMMSNSQKNNNVFDEATFEENRLARDAKARESMEQALVKEIQEDYPKSWKWKIRKWFGILWKQIILRSFLELFIIGFLILLVLHLPVTRLLFIYNLELHGSSINFCFGD